MAPAHRLGNIVNNHGTVWQEVSLTSLTLLTFVGKVQNLSDKPGRAANFLLKEMADWQFSWALIVAPTK